MHILAFSTYNCGVWVKGDSSDYITFFISQGLIMVNSEPVEPLSVTVVWGLDL